MNNNRQGERFGNDGESTNAKNLKAERESLGTGTTRTSLRLNILIKLKSTQTSPREERTSAYVALRGKKRQRGVQSRGTKRHSQALHSVDRKPLEDCGKKSMGETDPLTHFL